MRVTPIAASVVALGALLGGFTASSAGAPATVQQAAAYAPQTGAAVPDTGDNNGNG